MKKIILFFIISAFIFALILLFINYKKANGCLTVFTMDEISNYDIKNKNHLWIDDDFYLNSCNENTFDCSNFCTKADAKKVFDECYNAPKDDNPVPDIHNLANDNDKIPCESLK